MRRLPITDNNQIKTKTKTKKKKERVFTHEYLLHIRGVLRD